MGFVGRLLERRSSPAYPEDWLIKAFGGRASATGLDVSETTALYAPAVYSCVRVIAESLSTLPLPVYRRLPAGGRERAPAHPLYAVLHDQPNPEMTAVSFREAALGHLLLWGNAYAEIVRDGAGAVRELWPLDPTPTRTKPKRVNGQIVYEVRPPNSAPVTLPAERVLHIPAFSHNGLVGYSVIGLQREAVASALALQEFGNRFFGNGARPGGVLQHPGKLSDQAYERLKNEFELRHGGLSNAQRLAILEEGLTYQQIGIPPEDAQFLESRKFSRAEIAGLFRVPPHMIGDLERATFCMPADVEVYTETGPRSIRDVRPGDRVWSRGDAGVCLSTVQATALSGYERVLTLRTTNRTLRLTAGHRVLARRRVLQDAPRALGGVPVATGWQRVEWQTDWVRAGDLKPGDTIVTLATLPDGGSVHAPTRPNVSEEFMEFCGLLVGDGNVNDGGVTIARAASALYMDHYRAVMQQEFQALHGNGRNRALDRRRPIRLQEGERQTRFRSVLAAEELRLLGLSGTARTKRVPDWVFRLTPALRLAFLRGYLDSDGSVDTKGRITFSSVSRDLLSQMRHLCIGLGIPVTNLRRQDKVIAPLDRRPVQSEQYSFVCSDPGANRRIGSHDPRYVERLAAARPFGRKDRNYPRYGGAGFAERGLSLSRIVAIEDGAIAEPVYDLQVAGTASFVAGGVVVHNSNIEHQALEFVVHTLRPWAVRIEQTVHQRLLLPAERATYYAEHLFDGLLRGDIKSRYEALAIARQNGVINADEWRELENLNPQPDGQGRLYLVPLNMVPADQVANPPEPEPAPAPGTGSARRSLAAPETRAAESRRRLAASYRRVFADAARRIVRREEADILREARRQLGRRAAVNLREWLRDFYRDAPAWIAELLLPALEAYAEAIGPEAMEEIGADPTGAPDLSAWLREHAGELAAEHSAISEGDLLRLLDAAGAGAWPDEDLLTAVEQKLSGWREERPDQIAGLLAVSTGAAVARQVWRRSGIRRLRWKAFSSSCPYCTALNGRVVGIDDTFLDAGADFAPEGAKSPLRPRRPVRHAPAHSKCDCTVVPGL